MTASYFQDCVQERERFALRLGWLKRKPVEPGVQDPGIRGEVVEQPSVMAKIPVDVADFPHRLKGLLGFDSALLTPGQRWTI